MNQILLKSRNLSIEKNVKTIFNAKNEGFSKANNQGIEYALKK